MTFDDIAAKMKQKREAKGAQQKEKAFDPEEAYRLRGKMLGVLMRDARVSAARTVEECARLLRVTPELVEAWEYGDAVPTLPQLELMAYYLDVPVSHFWGTNTLEVARSKPVMVQTEYMILRDRMIGALLRQAREEQNMSVEDLSQAVFVPADRITSYELGELSIPMTELSVLAVAVKKNIDYFLESGGQIGKLLEDRESWKHFSELPDDLREFAANPRNIGFIEIALMLSQMPADKLRRVGESVLNIAL